MAETENKLAGVATQSLPILFLTGSLVLGSLINSFPDGTSLINITELTHNCTLDSSIPPFLPDTSSSSSHLQTLALVFSLIFPIIFNFLKQSQFSNVSSSKTLLPIYNHISGQVLGFSSSEFLRHFLQFPQVQEFVKTCNLTQETCQMHENIFTPLSILCLDTSWDQKALFNTLHTVPNINFVLLGASTISLLISYTSSSTAAAEGTQHQLLPIVTPGTEEEEEEEKGEFTLTSATTATRQETTIKFCTLQYFKFTLLTIYVVACLYYLWQSLNFNKLPEMALSYSQGVFIQICVHYASTKKDLNFVSLLVPSSFTRASKII